VVALYDGRFNVSAAWCVVWIALPRCVTSRSRRQPRTGLGTPASERNWSGAFYVTRQRHEMSITVRAAGVRIGTLAVGVTSAVSCSGSHACHIFFTHALTFRALRITARTCCFRSESEGEVWMLAHDTVLGC
jgi:hypothetical protein